MEKKTTRILSEKEGKKVNCVDCVSWQLECKKGKLGVTALSVPCSEFKQRPMATGIVAPKKPQAAPRTYLRKFGRQECIGCNYKNSSYCYQNCPYNLWKVQRY